jgi:hypothetical protein
VGLKAIDFYALSCGSFRKKARNLIKTAQRKSQLLVREQYHTSDRRGLVCSLNHPHEKLSPEEAFWVAPAGHSVPIGHK